LTAITGESVMRVAKTNVCEALLKGDKMTMNSDQAKGKLKEAAGVLTDDDKLKDEGKADQMVGDAKNVVKDVADKAGQVIDDIKNAVRKD
jgi:uncharacterized protein YjbJ (UPF0337 family)